MVMNMNKEVAQRLHEHGAHDYHVDGHDDKDDDGDDDDDA